MYGGDFYSIFKVLVGGRFPLGQTPKLPDEACWKIKVRPAPLFDRWGKKALDLFGRGEKPTGKIFLPVKKVLSLIPPNRPFFACERLIFHFI